jgi:hypothetical protein
MKRLTLHASLHRFIATVAQLCFKVIFVAKGQLSAFINLAMAGNL